MSLVRKWMPSPNYSSRGGTAVRLIVLHTTEGATTIESLGNWFGNPANQVSSHTGADDKPNTIGEYVHREQKAWTAANANPYSVQLEMCAYASWDAAEWDRHPNMLENTAAWVAEEAAAFGIPIVRLTADQAQRGAAGVCQHVDLGAAGGGHWDCGDSFPIDRVIDMANRGATPPQEVADMGPATCVDREGQTWFFTTGADGQIWANGNGAMGNWWSIGGGNVVDPHSGPDASATPDGTLSVVARGADGQIWVTNRNPRDGTWSPWWTMGGK